MPRFSEQRQKEEIMNKVKQILSVLLCTALCVSSFALTALLLIFSPQQCNRKSVGIKIGVERNRDSKR